MNDFKQMNDETLLEEFAMLFAAITFVDHKDINDEYERYKQEVLRRISQGNNIDLNIENLLADEHVIINMKNIDEISKKLFQELKIDTRQRSNRARIIACMDNSGSMGNFEKYLARSFMFWNQKIIERLYTDVKNDFITFHTESKYVDNEEFYTKGESGGTIVSSGLNKVNELINSYDYHNEDTYVFILTDGDNLTSDNERVIRIIDDLQRKSNHVCYFEINQYNRSSTLMCKLKYIDYPDFSKHIVRKNQIFILR